MTRASPRSKSVKSRSALWGSLQRHDAEPGRLTELCAADAMLAASQDLDLDSRRQQDFTLELVQKAQLANE